MLSRASDPRMVRVTQVLARFCALLVAAVALLTLIGWEISSPTLKTLSASPDHVAMNPLTAVTFILLAGGLWILCGVEAGPAWRSRQFAHLIALIVGFIGVQRLLNYKLGWP